MIYPIIDVVEIKGKRLLRLLNFSDTKTNDLKLIEDILTEEEKKEDRPELDLETIQKELLKHNLSNSNTLKP